MNRLRQKYEKEVLEELSREFGIKNINAAPKLAKIVINAGIGGIIKNASGIESLKKDIAAISGQTPSIRSARVSVASFGIRAGMPVGISVTLRGDRMYAFLDRLFSIVLPRLRDFRGISLDSFDKFGNYTLALTEHTVFPEIDLAKSFSPHGLEITIVIKAGSKEKSRKLLELLGCPFKKEEQK